MRYQRCDRGLLPSEEPAIVDCGACGDVVADPLGGPPVLSPLEERVAALEERLKGLERPDSVGCTDCNIVRALTGRGTARCRSCGPVGR
jgi:hypothetical protein